MGHYLNFWGIFICIFRLQKFQRPNSQNCRFFSLKLFAQTVQPTWLWTRAYRCFQLDCGTFGPLEVTHYFGELWNKYQKIMHFRGQINFGVGAPWTSHPFFLFSVRGCRRQAPPRLQPRRVSWIVWTITATGQDEKTCWLVLISWHYWQYTTDCNTYNFLLYSWKHHSGCLCLCGISTKLVSVYKTTLGKCPWEKKTPLMKSSTTLLHSSWILFAKFVLPLKPPESAGSVLNLFQIYTYLKTNWHFSYGPLCKITLYVKIA